MVLVDTNILAYLLIADERTAPARRLLERDPDWHSETFILAELLNVLATNVRADRLSLPAAMAALLEAHSVVGDSLHQAEDDVVLSLAIGLGVSAYDARFLAIARDLGTALVTEDAKLRKAAPAYTQSLAEAVAAA
jgi:predicted nucleic acid-binding protein